VAQALTRLNIKSSERNAAHKAADFLDRTAMLGHGGLFAITADGKTLTEELPRSLLAAMKGILAVLSETGEAVVLNPELEISAEKAAELLGMSRPLVYQRMDSGKLPFRLVGAHRRIRINDVMILKKFEERRRGFAEALTADAEKGKSAGRAKRSKKSIQRSSNLPRRPSDIDQLVLGTTNAPYRRTMNAADLVARITSRDWHDWTAHVVTFFTEVRPELVLEFARFHAIPIQDLATSYRSMKSATGEANPALESALEQLA